MFKQHYAKKAVITCVFMFLLLSAGHGQVNWTKYNPLPVLSGITWTGKQFVAVGDSGCIVSSPDMAVWSMRTTGTSRYLHSVAWTGSSIVAVGDSGTIITSPDGIYWSSVNAGTASGLKSVIWTGATLMAVGEKGTVLTSPDGQHWTSSNSGTTRDLYSATWANGQFLAVGGINNNFANGAILTSPDGAQWTDRSSASVSTAPYFYSVAGIRNSFIVIGDSHTIISSDGVTWTSHITIIDNKIDKFLSVTTDGSQFAGLSRAGTVYFSSDGLTWTSKSAQLSNSLKYISWIDSQYVAVGNAGAIATSPDGSGWKSRLTGTVDNLSCIAWNGKQFVAAGWVDNSIHTSLDGINWTSWQSQYNLEFGAVIWTGARFVLVGGSGTIGIIYTSTDSMNWEKRYFSADEIYDVTWTGTQLVAVGRNGTILTSPDGVDWTSRISGTTNILNSVVWTGDRFVAIGFPETGQLALSVVTSIDGQNWTCDSVRVDTIGSGLYSLVWTGAQFAALRGNGEIVTSADAHNWTVRNSCTVKQLTSMVWTGRQLVAVGIKGTIISSPDGVKWKSAILDTTINLFSVKWTDSRLVAVGNNGIVLLSPEEVSAVAPYSIVHKTAPITFIKSTGRNRIKVNLRDYQGAEKISFRIFNTLGKCVQYKTDRSTSPDYAIPVNGLASGRYFLQADVKGKKVMFPFVIGK